MSKEGLSIGEVADKAGISVSAIRFQMLAALEGAFVLSRVLRSTEPVDLAGGRRSGRDRARAPSFRRG